MTDQNAEPAPSQPASAAGTPRLRRRATDRVAAGVAAGLADYLNVDPLLIRVGLVGLVLFNGAGLFIYLAAWLFIPVEGSDTSIVEDWIRRLGGNGAAVTVALVFLGIMGVLVLLSILGRIGTRMGVEPEFVVALLVIVGGILLVRRTASGGPTSGTERAAVGDPTIAAGTSDTATRERRRRARQDRSPLGLYALGFMLLAVGALAAVDIGTATDFLPRAYAGLALAVLGLALVVGAWWGRARWLILVGLFLVPVALALSFVTVPLDGDWGDRRAAPTSTAELLDEYQLAGGRLTVDLSDLPPSPTARHISASIGIGRLLVILPVDTRAEIVAEVGAGTSDLLGARQEGTGLTDRNAIDGSGGGFVLDLEAGIGSVLVRTAAAGE